MKHTGTSTDLCPSAPAGRPNPRRPAFSGCDRDRPACLRIKIEQPALWETLGKEYGPRHWKESLRDMHMDRLHGMGIPWSRFFIWLLSSRIFVQAGVVSYKDTPCQT